jgi:hypothetical protein
MQISWMLSVAAPTQLFRECGGGATNPAMPNLHSTKSAASLQTLDGRHDLCLP